MLINKKLSLLLLAVVITVVYLLVGFISLDPDFGYRLLTGGKIIASGFPRNDPYSYTMPSFPYVEHAWLVAVVWAKLFPLLGKIGLVLLSLIAAFLAVYVSLFRVQKEDLEFVDVVSKQGKRLWQLRNFIVIISFASLLSFFGVRAQVFSWLMLSVLFLIVLNKNFWDRFKYFLPIYFLFWSNLHGSFLAGILTLTFVTGVRWLRERRFSITDIVILSLSLLATFINPYGVSALREAISSVTDTKIRWEISEWMPAFLRPDLIFVSYMTLSLALVIKQRRFFNIEEKGLYILLLMQAVMSVRHIPVWVIMSLPTTIIALNSFYKSIIQIKFAKPRFVKMYNYALVGSVLIFIFQSFFAIRGAQGMSKNVFYPSGAVAHLRVELPAGETFSNYGWGGYLVREIPDRKVFINGNMPSWRWSENPKNETGSAFDDYLEILNGKLEYSSEFEKYGIDTVLWPKPRDQGILATIGERIDPYLKMLGKEKKIFDFLKTLEEDGWELSFEDNVAVIYKKPT